jgi:hypothetical protein
MKRWMLALVVSLFSASVLAQSYQGNAMMNYQQQQAPAAAGQMPPGSMSYASQLQPGQYMAQAPQGVVGEHAAYAAPVARGCGARGGYSAIEGGITPQLQQAPPPSGGVYHP